MRTAVVGTVSRLMAALYVNLRLLSCAGAYLALLCCLLVLAVPYVAGY
jgi:hypothetical protein